MISETLGFSNRNVDWAVETFRPLLQSLHLQQVGVCPTVVKAADFRSLVVKGMGRCVIAVQRQKISEERCGYCVFIHEPKRNLFVLSIVINEIFFAEENLPLRIQRKALGIHEFVHCVAIMMSLSLLGTGPNPLIDRLKKILSEKLTVTSSEDFTALLNALEAISIDAEFQKTLPFNDKHFRTGFEDFPDDYADLNFLFSYKLLQETIDIKGHDTFKRIIIGKDTEKLIQFLNDVISEISDTKALEKEFVFRRFVYFLPRLTRDLL